jgi:cell wall-associated NlpC family hydrolase
MTALDRRLHAYRPELADERLSGQVEAAQFVRGRPARVAVVFADVKRAPERSAGLDTQLLHGDDVLVFDQHDGWAWVQAGNDGYVGYVEQAALGERADEPTHMVVAPRTFLYPGADMKLPRSGYRSMGSRLTVSGMVETRGTSYAMLPSGEAVVASHLRPVGEAQPDYVAAAETLLHAPYLWGGATAFGVDCSGLVQLAMRMAGRKVLRDTDMQASTIGDAIDPGPGYAGLRRGDLVFWKGHVAILIDPDTIIHANGHTMSVAIEPLAAAVDRIGYLYGRPTSFRRP